MRRKAWKRLTAGLLCALMMAGVMVQPALANSQLHIGDLKIELTPSAAADQYQVRLNWTRPPALPGDTHQATTYNLFMWNLTRRETKPTNAYKIIDDPGTGTDRMYEETFSHLEPGSLYKFQMLPIHTHVVVNPSTGVPTLVNAPYDTSLQPAEALLLTDIRVEAAGVGQELTVTWDNPFFENGREIFSGYKIYYQLYGGSSGKITDSPSAVTEIVMQSNPKLVHTGSKLSYTFHAPGIEQGRLYAVAVEPLYGTPAVEFRKLATKTTITEGGRSYPLAFSEREYRTNNAYVRPSLYVEESGQELIRLYWDSFRLSSLNIVDLKIFESTDPNMDAKLNIGTYSSEYARNSSDMFTSRPQTARYYQLEVSYNETVSGVTTRRTMSSEIILYLPNYEAFKPTKPGILEVKDAVGSPLGLHITWEAFTRMPYNDMETQLAINGRFVDQDIEYDVWVADNLAYFEDSLFTSYKTLDSLDAHTLQMLSFQDGDYTKQAYAQSVRTYVTQGESGAYEIRPIVDNKLYYVRIVARRTNSILKESSDPAYASYFMMPTGNIATRPPVVSKPPLRIKVVDLVEQITDNSITMQWDRKWFEIYDGVDTWFTEVGIEGDVLYFGDDITDAMRQNGNVLQLNDPAYQLSDNVQDGKRIIEDQISGKMANPPDPMPPLRMVDLRQAQVEIRVVETSLLYETDYLTYINGLTDADWTTITPSGDPLHPEYKVTTAHAPVAGPLDPNKTYTILFRPYVILADGKKAAYQPAALTATTLSKRLDPEVTPIVPVLEPDGQTDVTVTVKFPYADGLQYELRWSEVMSDYPDGGQVINAGDIVKNGLVTSNGTDRTMHTTIRGLFPKTTYYVWVRSIATANGVNTPSGWSNPISMSTLSIAPPNKPQGLGLAAETHIDIYNKENNATLLPTGSDYMNIVWLRDIVDAETGSGSISGSDLASLLASPNFTGIYIVKFDELIANHAYYIRAKTRLTITKNGTENVATYQYVVQFSPEADFMDAMEIVVGTTPAGGDSVSAESGWCDVVRLFTKQYTGEYDGDKNPDMYPLPEQDFEIIYDRATDTLTYRFRSTGKDSGGNADNMVDQRFISRLVSEGLAQYELDMTGYVNLIAKNRVLVLPYTIVKAMEEMKVSLALTAGDMTFTFKPGFVNAAEVKTLRDYGVSSQITITLNENPTGVVRPTGQSSFATPAQRLSVTVKTPASSVTLASLAVPATLSMKLTNRSVAYDSNVGAYYFDKSQNAWARIDGKYDSVTGRIETTVQRAGDYSVIAVKAPVQTGTPDAGANASAYVVNAALYFTDMASYNPNAYVTAGQMNQILSALANGQKDVAINVSLSGDAQQALVRAGLFVQGGATVSRENAVTALVKLYEIKTRFPVQGYPMLAASPYQDINSAASAAKLPLLKAGYLGFFGDRTTASPKTALTFKDMLLMVDIIVQDAGL